MVLGWEDDWEEMGWCLLQAHVLVAWNLDHLPVQTPRKLAWALQTEEDTYKTLGERCAAFCEGMPAHVVGRLQAVLQKYLQQRLQIKLTFSPRVMVC